nr:LOW QUALITY PROTEIN: age-related maculopathy susceptibility protein 2 [Macaca fascicularis]
MLSGITMFARLCPCAGNRSTDQEDWGRKTELTEWQHWIRPGHPETARKKWRPVGDTQVSTRRGDRALRRMEKGLWRLAQWKSTSTMIHQDGSWLGKGIAPLSPRHVSVLYVLHLHPGPTVTEVEGKGGPEMASLSSSVVSVSFISTHESLLDTGVGGEGASDRQRSKLSLSHSKIPAAKIYPELYLPAFFSLAGTSSVLDQQP